MTKVNIVFDDIFDDADIIAVPDELIPRIEEISQEFLFWKPSLDDKDNWLITDGKICLVKETDGFIKWLNSTYCKNIEKAYVIVRNTNYCPDYKIIEF